MSRYLFTLLFLAVTTSLKAQVIDSTKTASDDSKTFVKVDVEPQFPGGASKMIQYLKRNEKSNGNEGKVWVSFVVEKDGSLSNITIVKSLSESADKEATRLMSQSPKWIPGMQGGNPVRVKYSMPVNFPAL